MKQTRTRVAFAAALVVLTVGLLYHCVATGGMSARQKPSALVTFIAQKLVQLGIRRDARERKNPADTSPGGADVALGRALYETHCQVCHGADGTGKTAAGGGLYPPPLDLSRAALARRNRTDGELFYLVRNGIRMPAWPLTDEQTWDVVAFLRNLPLTAPGEGAGDSEGQGPSASATYLGSGACKECHAAIYDRWIKTPMANVVRDPREHPDATVADFAKADPPVGFTVDDVALTYGSRWKQRYFKKVGDDYFVFPAQWDVTTRSGGPIS